jgi:signal transduction histidine kinase
MELGELLSRLSHELKNPVTASTLAVQMLVREVPEEHKDSLRQLEQQLRLCDWTLDVVLDINRKAEGRLVLNRSSQVVIKSLGPVIDGCSVEFRRPILVTPGSDEVEASVDRNRVRNLTGQLLRNALRYSEGAVNLTVSALAPAGCEISVTDEGPGFPLELLRGEVRPRPDRTGGLGLGLVFCQLIAREHGGDLRLENFDAGARATAILPSSS